MSRATRPGPVDLFEAERPRLLGLAYRMLGTVSDAEDVVQDAWLRWRGADPTAVERPEAWLTTVTTRLALDHIRTTRRRRESYIGPWLPEPLVTEPGPDDRAETSESLRLGFLTLLDRLQPVERAVFLLSDVFAVPFADIARAVDKSPPACRQIASRARRKVRRPSDRCDRDGERDVVAAVTTAIALGHIDQVVEHLAPGVVCVADGGAARRAARRPVVGAPRVARLLVNLSHRYTGRMSARPVMVNGDLGVVIELDDEVDLVTAFEVDGGRVPAVRMVRNPDKLARVGRPVSLC